MKTRHFASALVALAATTQGGSLWAGYMHNDALPPSFTLTGQLCESPSRCEPRPADLLDENDEEGLAVGRRAAFRCSLRLSEELLASAPAEIARPIVALTRDRFAAELVDEAMRSTRSKGTTPLQLRDDAETLELTPNHRPLTPRSEDQMDIAVASSNALADERRRNAEIDQNDGVWVQFDKRHRFRVYENNVRIASTMDMPNDPYWEIDPR